MSNDGKSLEILVQMIERSISPESRVEHNVQMPILNSPKGFTTQCDIVIRTGNPPRETTTIVEVQDRGSQVKPNDFRGWKQKLEEVGAQHLICVSRQEFPESVKEQAALSGNSIRLVTLKELTAESMPIDLFKLEFAYKDFAMTELKILDTIFSKSEAEGLGIREKVLARKETNTNEKCWSLDKFELLSLHQLALKFYHPQKGIKEGEGKLSFSVEEEPYLYLFESGHFLKIGMNVEFKWKNEVIRQPVAVLSYEQDKHGALAWAVDFSYKSPQGIIGMKMPIVKDGDRYAIRELSFILPPETELALIRGKLDW